MTLPFQISTQTVGAQKAYERFVKQYGKKEGERIFLQYAEDYGTGNTIADKVNSVFHTGAKVSRSIRKL